MSLGILGPQPVVDAFRGAGVSVSADLDNMVATRLIKKRMTENPDFPILVVSTDDHRVPAPLIAALRQRASRLVVAGEDVQLPARLGDVASRLGLEITSGQDSILTAAGLEAPDDDDDDWLTDDLFVDEPMHESVPAASQPESEPEEPPALDLPDAPAGWSDPVAEAEPVAPQPSARATPPASWSAPVRSPEPTIQPTPEPAQQPPPMEGHGWSMGADVAAEHHTDSDFQDFLNDRARARESDPARRPASGIVVFCWAGGGGVGKSTYSRVLAQMAAEAGFRAVLFDANRGQADQAQYVLRGGASGYATIHLYATTGDIRAAITTADEANQVRTQRVAPVSFDSLFSPTPDAHDMQVHTPELYAQALRELKGMYDIILVDTQTLDHDSSDLWDGFIRPAMLEDAWAMGTSDDSAPKTKSLAELSQQFSERGVNPMRMLNTVTLTDPRPDDGEILATKFAPYSTFVGVIAFDEAFGQDMATGHRVITDSPAVDPVLRQVLRRITGSPVFDPRVEEPKRRFPFFGRKNKRG